MARCKIKTQSIEQLPSSFHQFMSTRGINIQELTIPIPRYVRVRPNTQITSELIAEDIGISLE